MTIIKKLEADQKGDLKANLLLRCKCRLDVHAEAFENARTEIKLANGQTVYKYPCSCNSGKPTEVLSARYFTA